MSLLLIGLLMGILEQQQTVPPVWREYNFPSDRFAITLPYQIYPHADTVNVGITVYTVRLGLHAVLSIRSKPTGNCASELKHAVEVIAESSGMAKPKMINFAGQIAYEDERKMSDHWSYTRLWCGDGRAFAATLAWPIDDVKPDKASKILNSFRVVSQPGDR